MNKQDIKVGMLVKSSLYASRSPPSVGMVIAYPGGHWFFVLHGEKIVSWNIGFCEPLTG
jgi:hypothetical protein